MNLNAIFQLLKSTALYLSLIATLVSCKKEQPDLPYNDIETFTIEDANGKPLQGVIKGEDIIIYWTPLMEDPESITPTIQVSENASISPASGTAVAYSEETKYTVTAQDGSKKTYTLRPQTGQPVPYITSNATAFNFNTVLAIGGDFFIPNTDKTKVYLVQNNKETALTDIRSLTNSSIQVFVPLTLDIDTGKYHVKVVTGKRVVTNGPYTLLKPRFSDMIEYATVAKTVTPGGVLTLDLKSEKGAGYYKNDQYEVRVEYPGQPLKIWPEIIQIEGTKLQVKVPSNAEKGMVYISIYDTKTTMSVYGAIPITIE
ncbi:hypothetical protein E2P86_06205 [Sphingobacterium psychroaquaticum]|uniref:hypothetical protein n=1 Tax=Sphingobacterium psychroaquaticum TaxID=561061 RepID=UPI0010699040|nr:hypothetical protein [Sphingobacterium psychroaquaticum]QBQ40765.1 hypothetical protein E2P86_06205 [Sphingobacterium psychroaquaticum]